MASVLCFRSGKFAAGVVVACLAAAAGCGVSSSGPSSSGGGAPGVTSTTITFGQTVPQSGPSALYGQSTAGVRAYFDMVNAQGGVKGHKLNLISYNDQYEPAVAVQLTRKLVYEDKVFAEVAVNGSATTKAALTIINPNTVPLVGPQTGADYLQKPPENVFNVWPSYHTEGMVLGKFASQQLHLTKICTFYQNDDFGMSLLRGVEATAKTALNVSYDPSQKDFSSDATQFKGAGCDSVLFLSVPGPTIQLLNSMNAIHYKPVRIMSQVAAIPNSFNAAPNEFPGSYIGAFIPALNPPNNPYAKQFVQAMHTYQPTAPVSVFSAWGWLEAHVAVAGLKNISGPITRDSYIKGLESINGLETMGGTVTYSKTDHSGLESEFMVKASTNALVPISS